MVQAESREAAKQVICELIAVAGGTLRGKIRLNKAFYFAHLYFWRDADGVLTDYPIVRLPLGPCIDDAEDILRELSDEGRIAIAKEAVGPYPEYVYSLTAPIPADGDEAKAAAVLAAWNFVKDRTGAELSEITHEHSRSWNNTPNGAELDIYSDLIEDDEYADIRRRVVALREREGEIWRGAEF